MFLHGLFLALLFNAYSRTQAAEQIITELSWRHLVSGRASCHRMHGR